ncbi:hypothetical protein JTB14_032283 [Gonioctena quinquepunctata]|nr:hypothetical protein JTB14_032283 [Gonioctena quinquepunctata]
MVHKLYHLFNGLRARVALEPMQLHCELSKLRNNELPFNSVKMTLEELYNEVEGPDTIADGDVEPVPSDCESEIDFFDDEGLVDNVPATVVNGNFEKYLSDSNQFTSIYDKEDNTQCYPAHISAKNVVYLITTNMVKYL